MNLQNKQLFHKRVLQEDDDSTVAIAPIIVGICASILLLVCINVLCREWKAQTKKMKGKQGEAEEKILMALDKINETIGADDRELKKVRHRVRDWEKKASQKRRAATVVRETIAFRHSPAWDKIFLSDQPSLEGPFSDGHGV